MELCNQESCIQLAESTNAQRKLIEERSLHREIFENIADCIFLLEVYDDKGFRYIKINRNLSEFFGTPLEIEREGRQGTLSPPLGNCPVSEKILSAADLGLQSECVVNEEISVDTPSGIRHFQASLTPLTGTGGRIDRILTVIRDIGDRKQAEQKANLMTHALDQLHEGVFVTDPGNDRISYVNHKACQSLGYERHELLGMSVADIDPNFDHLDIKKIGDSVRIQGSVSFETYHRRKDGSVFPVEIVKSIVTYENQTMSLSLVRDISEHKHSEETLRRAHAFTERLLNAVPDPVFAKDHKHRWILANDAFCALFGQPRAALLGKSDYDFQPKELADIFREKDEQVFAQGGENVYDETIIDAEGRLRYIQTKKSKIDDNTLIGVIRDMTEFKANQRMLAEAQDLAQLGSWDWDIVQDRVAWSEMAFAIYTPDQRPADPGYQDFLRSLHPEDKDWVMAAVQAAFDHDEPFDIEHRVVSQSKGMRTVHAQAKVFRDAGGNPVRMVGTVQDITERKLYERALLERAEIERRQSQYFAVAPGYFYTLVMKANGSIAMPFASAGIVDLYGLRPEDVARDVSLLVDRAHPDDVAMTFAAMQESARNLSIYQVEFRILHPEKGERWLEARSQPQRFEDGEIRWHGFMHDITERKRLEEDRRQNLRFFESMDRVNRALQGSNDLETAMNQVLDILLEIFDCDRAYLVYPCDPDAETWQVPFERTVPEYPGVHAFNISFPMNADDAMIFRELFRAEGPLTYGAGNRAPLPSEVTERFSIRSFMATALRPKGDKPWHFGIHQCSEDRVWTAEEQRLLQEIGRRLTDSLSNLLAFREIRDRERKFQSLADSMPDSICSYDLQVRKIYANLKLRRILTADFGHSWLGKTPKELYLDGSMDEHQARLEQVIKTGVSEDWEGSQPDAKDGTRYFQTRYAALHDYDGKIIGALAIFTYITKQRQLEQALIRNERELRLLLANTPGYIARFDLDLRRTFVSRAYEGTAKTTAAEVVGTTPLDYWRLASPTAEEFCVILRRIMETKTPERLETYALTAAGTRRYFSMDLAPEFDENGNVKAVLAVGLETTELKLAEQRRVEAREDERKILARELHDDLGQRLTALRLSVEILGLKFGSGSPELLEKIREIDAAVGDTVAIARNLLAMLRPMVLDLGLMPALEWLTGDFTRTTLIDCRLRTSQENIEFKTQHATAVYRIVQESLNNIAKHARAKVVDIALARRERNYVLEILDNGRGFDLNACRRKSGSFGLLGIEERVQLLGGRLAIDTAPGAGTKITVWIPVHYPCP